MQPPGQHEIFNNQPPYTIFDKKIDTTDSLYSTLNDVNRFFLKGENNFITQQQLVIDPRNKRIVPRAIIDNTVPNLTDAFVCQIPSELTASEQEAFCRVLKCMKSDFAKPNQLDLSCIQEKYVVREVERQYFQKFVHKQCKLANGSACEMSSRLMKCYQEYYFQKTRSLCDATEQLSWYSFKGLPIRYLRTNLNVNIRNVQLIDCQGWIPVWNSTKCKFDCRKLYTNIETYAERYNQNIDKVEQLLEMKLKVKLDTELKKFKSCNKYIIPLESILFLLTAGDYHDLPTELLLEIKDDDNDNGIKTKTFNFEKPLAAKNIGWHTNQKIVEQALAAFISVPSSNTCWSKIDGDDITLESLKIDNEISGILEENSMNFKLIEFDEYLNAHQSHNQHVKTNMALVKWCLENENSNADNITILTKLKLPPIVDIENRQFLGNHSIKLENKPKFGCEIKTKYELMREWLNLRLLQDCGIAKNSICTRISVGKFQFQLQQQSNIEQLEAQIQKYYKKNMSNELAHLEEFLKLLSNMPNGKYMLRYNPDYQNQFILCCLTKNAAEGKSKTLQNLLDVIPTDLCFKMQDNFLPIADDLISVMHIQNSLLPCAFYPVDDAEKRQRMSGYLELAKGFNDRDEKLKAIQQDRELHAQLAKRVKYAKKKLRKSEKKYEKECETTKLDEFEQFLSF